MKTVQRPGIVSYQKSMKRRQFLSYAAASATFATAIAACRKDGNLYGDVGIDLGSNDLGILNYAYALEQLEAAFYTKLIEKPYDGIGDDESLLTDIRDHEIVHREFFRKLLGTNAIPDLEMDFSSIDFTNKNSVLSAAKTFEDLGVSAYNGAGQLLSNAENLLIAGKIVSVEARHAAYIRDLISEGSFADSTAVNADGLDLVASPTDVLAAASKFIVTKLDASHLPTA